MMQTNDEYLRRADGSIYGVKESPERDAWVEAWANLDRLPYPVFDGTGCRVIDLGSDVYALVDFDTKYRVGIYFNLPEDDGGVCAEFERFVDLEAFCLRLSCARAPWDSEGPYADGEAQREGEE